MPRPSLAGCGFQSAPLTDVRGDTGARIRSEAGEKWFQSAPLTDVRGDAVEPGAANAMVDEFQSAPLTDVRGDSEIARLRDAVRKVSIRSPH